MSEGELIDGTPPPPNPDGSAPETGEPSSASAGEPSSASAGEPSSASADDLTIAPGPPAVDAPDPDPVRAAIDRLLYRTSRLESVVAQLGGSKLLADWHP